MTQAPMRSGWQQFSDLMARPWIPLLGTLALVVAGILATLYEEQLYRAQKVDEVTVQGRILAASVTAALVFRDDAAAREYVAALQANPELEAVGVYDLEGRLFAGFVDTGVEPLPSQASLPGARVADNLIAVVLPVVQDRAPVGSVYLRATLQPLALRVARYGGIILLLTMAVLVLAVSLTAQRALKRANVALALQARDLAASNVKLHSEIIERAKAEEALRQSQKMEAIGQLSGGIAHDFNNLITIILGNLRLLRRRIAQGRTDVQSYIDAATETLNRAAALTQRILAFSRQQPLSPLATDVNQLLVGMADLLRHSVGDLVKFDWRLEADWPIFCDNQQLETVILNVAINARDAMPDGGTVGVETANLCLSSFSGDIPPGEYVALRISDSGMGMSDEVRRKAIDPFFTTKPPGRGTGLGLSMTVGFVQQSGGHLKIESEVGRGTIVTILMPRHVHQVMEAAS